LLKMEQGLPAGGHKLLGDLHRGLNDYAQALDHYFQELARNKGDTDLLRAMAETYEEMKDLPQALVQWQRLLDLDPQNRDAKNKTRLIKRKLESKQRSAKRR
ncbi:MAG: tetratricopeptide repeat protein, partial [Elusimicrobia bacterium]|nr:tetratricopeptide repeat protein [Elusimicrobiota bacterium]